MDDSSTDNESDNDITVPIKQQKSVTKRTKWEIPANYYAKNKILRYSPHKILQSDECFELFINDNLVDHIYKI